MAGIMDVKNKHWHGLGIQILLLIIIVGIYYSLKNDPKIVAIPGSISICLLGSYIGLNAILSFGHEFYHSRYHTQPEKITS